MSTTSKPEDNENTPKEEWLPVGYEAIQEEASE
jgi:hypothetical protein